MRTALVEPQLKSGTNGTATKIILDVSEVAANAAKLTLEFLLVGIAQGRTVSYWY